ncbi:MAG TPA: NADP-dependent oxidoreductase [Steroidobacteraceae bacterium]|jgi:NADPH:quinone reductase-like Zn-dependent oxidoreductase|nr:NADP-dependent oxidoreductase [Steroidobacteraceae bacterium]
MSDQANWIRCRGLLSWTAVLGITVTMASAAEVPRMMQAIVQRGFGGPDVLKLERLPVPQPGADQVLVHVYAAGINPLDWRARMGVRRQDQGGPAGPREQQRTPASGRVGATSPRLSKPTIPGDEMAGVIAAVGPGVANWHVGEAVYGRSAGGGDYAQYVTANSDGIAPKPKRLTFEQAAGIPIAGITAVLAVEQAGVKRGQTLVIVGAAGGVGSAALQIAKAQGVRVITIAASRHDAYLKQLGADEVVDYDRENPAEKIMNADAVINLVDGPAAGVLSYVKRGGAIVLPAGLIPRDKCVSAGVTCNGMDRGNRQKASDLFAQINRLAEAGLFTIKVEKAFPLGQAGQAQELDRAGHAEGKIVLITTPAASEH